MSSDDVGTRQVRGKDYIYRPGRHTFLSRRGRYTCCWAGELWAPTIAYALGISLHFASVAEDINTPENSFLPTFNPNVLFGDGMVGVRDHAPSKFDPKDMDRVKSTRQSVERCDNAGIRGH